MSKFALKSWVTCAKSWHDNIDFPLVMAGIYIHTPFCKSRCIYCGFFSTTSLSKSKAHTDAVCRELEARRGYLRDDIDTIYFGGGTPTQLPLPDLQRIFDTIHTIYNVREEAEITVEGNPDDLTPEVLASLRQMGVNRLSMGVQTFDDLRLKFLHRRHSSQQAVKAVADAKAAGFCNISVDLMFGFPGQTLEEWKCDVQRAIALGVQHVSAYSLMYEEGTALGNMLDRGDIEEVPDELSLSMYEHLMDALDNAGFEHYEISNFALPGYRSRHNSSYWSGIPYLGVGAGAHSFDGHDRHFNPDSLALYLEGKGQETEELTDSMRYDEYVFTSLRTSDGLNLDSLAQLFGSRMRDYCLRNAESHIKNGKLALHQNALCLTRAGLFVSNDIMSDLMYVE